MPMTDPLLDFRRGTGMAMAMIVVAMASHALADPLATADVRSSSRTATAAFDGVVEAVQQTAIAAQVSGAIVEIAVRPGDRIKAGQLLVRVDANAAEQSLAASEADVRAARASLDVAAKELARQRLLFEKNYTSRAALDRAEAQFKATEAQVSAQIAQAGAARAQSGYFVVRAPYAGVVADVPAMPGDMAMPGRPLVIVYDPAALRIAASVPETAIRGTPHGPDVGAEIPGLPGVPGRIAPTRVEVLPTLDAGTHTVIVRLALPTRIDGARPGMFARVWLPGVGSAEERLFVPASSVVRRAEMTGVYVVDARGRAILRQVRLGRASDGEVEVLSGIDAGERVALEPQAAARQAIASR